MIRNKTVIVAGVAVNKPTCWLVCKDTTRLWFCGYKSLPSSATLTFGSTPSVAATLWYERTAQRLAQSPWTRLS